MPAHVQQRQAARASSGVRIAGVTPNAQLVKLAARSAGSAVAVTGTFGRMPVTVAAISERGKSSEAVGDEAAAAFRRYQKQAGVVPSALCGSLLPFLCLTEQPSRLTTEAPRDSLEAEARLLRAFTGREVRIAGEGSGPAVVTVGPGRPVGV